LLLQRGRGAGRGVLRRLTRGVLAGLLGAAGLCVHSVFDGVAIGISFQVNPKIGLLIALAIIAHDFSAGDERLHQLHR